MSNPETEDSVFYWMSEDDELEVLDEETFMERVRVLLEAQRQWDKEIGE